ncbi:MAG: DUF190 domain-containing protein [Sphingomonas sp.]|jgi:hypothetical protein|uniref:DUF190 domain-containing protein n=1 Tax=Sphingomonas sp. TaxID=28214 RepID=UPI00334ADFDC
MEAQPHFLLRVYTDEAAMVGDRRGFDFVLDRAREAGLLGATVQRAAAGFGHGAHLHRRGLIDHNFPVIVEIVDEEGRVRDFWAGMAATTGIGLVTLERVEVLSSGPPAPSRPA